MNDWRRSAPRPWIDAALGGQGTKRRWISNTCLLIFGIQFAYIKVDRASLSRPEPKRNQGTLVSDLVVPEPLFQMAIQAGENRCFRDFQDYLVFLDAHGLTEGVLIIRVRSLSGEFLYDGFPLLSEHATFTLHISRLPELVSTNPGASRSPSPTSVQSVPAPRLSSRQTAEEAYFEGAIPFIRGGIEAEQRSASSRLTTRGR